MLISIVILFWVLDVQYYRSASCIHKILLIAIVLGSVFLK